jgi:hypothetical protein
LSPLEDTDLALTYAVDVWTGASIDIRTMATPAVTEQRDELVAAVTHRSSPLTLMGTYRYSTERPFVTGVSVIQRLASSNEKYPPCLRGSCSAGAQWMR